jgi:DnaJ-domain-containing protein 1
MAERYGQDPFQFEANRTDRELEILEAQERLRLAEEQRDRESELKILAATAGVQM